MMWGFNYENYQDVRRNLFLYSTPFLVVAGFFAYFWILPPAHRASVSQFFALLRVQGWWQGISGVGVFSAIAFLLTEIFQVHDQWYDRYVTKWRFRYDTDFILPRLIQPFSSQISRRFHEVAEKNVPQFMEKLYYHYVRDRETKIGKNKLVRFYEVITIYWLTQINEVVFLLLFIMVGTYRFIGPTDVAYRTMLLDSALILSVAFLLNRMCIKFSREKVRRATDDEIDAIIEKYSEDLGNRIRNLCREYDIQFSETSKVQD